MAEIAKMIGPMLHHYHLQNKRNLLPFLDPHAAPGGLEILIDVA